MKLIVKKIKIGIEFDIQLTKDEKLICFHDKNMKRLFNKDYIIENINSEIIKEFKDICYLDDILNFYKDNKNIILNIEVKCFQLSELKKILCDKIINLVEKYDCNFIISSFNYEIVNYLGKNKNNFLVGYIIDNFDKNEYNKIKNRIDYLICNKSINKDLILKISEEKILIFTLYNNSNISLDDDYLIKYFYKNKNIGFITDNIYKFL